MPHFLEKKSQIRPRKASDPPLLSRLLHTGGTKESEITSSAGGDTVVEKKSSSSDKIKASSKPKLETTFSCYGLEYYKNDLPQHFIKFTKM